MVVLTYRNDDIDDAHPVRRLLGALATQPVQRLQLRPLSRRAVNELAADAGVDPASVFSTTGGNPFFVTEVLACGDERCPHDRRRRRDGAAPRAAAGQPGGARAARGGPVPGAAAAGPCARR